ncbi:MAG: hypothetical protein WA960_13580 [Tunicatimonas sp.]
MNEKQGLATRRNVPKSISKRFRNKAHTENSLIFQTSPTVTIATNKFENVPIILKYEDINLIEVVKEHRIGFTTRIPIYHQDGTYLAKAVGNRLYRTEEGKKANLKIERYEGVWVCELNGQALFEIRQQTGNAFKATAELYTSDGYFIKCTDDSTRNLIKSEDGLQIGGITMFRNTFVGCEIGIWYKKDGACSIGANE